MESIAQTSMPPIFDEVKDN